MADPLFTVLLPINRPPAMLPFAVESVLGQSEKSFELCIICDGAPASTVESALALAGSDSRIKVFAFEKGERHGEAHRHHVLTLANTRYVAQIGDDDLWLPDYLSELSKALERADLANLPQVDRARQGDLGVVPGSLEIDAVRERMLSEHWNIFGPTFAGYRLEAYRQLPVGWSPAPLELCTDIFMWRKFLAMPGFRFATHFSIQGLKFSACSRADMSLEERASEIRDVVENFKSPAERARFQINALEALARSQHANLRYELSSLEAKLISDFDGKAAESSQHKIQIIEHIRGEKDLLSEYIQCNFKAINDEIEEIRSKRIWSILQGVSGIKRNIERIEKIVSRPIA